MIRIIEGDLIKDGPMLIAHQVNCKGKMGAGLAKQIKETFPEVFEEYHLMTWNKAAHSDTKKLLGQVQVVPSKEQDRFIANLFGQNNYGKGRVFTQLEYLKQSLEILKAMCIHNLPEFPFLKEIGIPFGIGCGHGGETWDRVFSMLVDVFGEEGEEIDLIIYKLK